ncbi:maleylpyruvate isomerase family mycothiol-dependent enzyme [Actinomadura sp. 21ATH]|uniref:maleylpyruvate isomerase family mycothiol-dependent enzyme n=1 Tax=Actinomadura sp. 21ATH TaxID=1735444 RepID=UPI0035C25502
MDQTLAWLETERLDLAGFLDGLSGAEWAADSLCPGWTVRDVAAHLTLSTRVTFPATVKGMIRARGDWDRMTGDMARERAARFEPADLVAQIRETAGSSHRAPGAGLLDPLVDTLVHGQDIARPLGRVRRMPTGPAIAGLDHVRTSRFYGARKRLRGLRLAATDADWSAGEGPEEIRGPAADLLLIATGRRAGLTGVSGSGLDRLTAAMRP